jgi:hypothetical protein
MRSRSQDAAKLEPKVLSEAVLADFRTVVGENGIIAERNQLQTYECDGLTALRILPARRCAASIQG